MLISICIGLLMLLSLGAFSVSADDSVDVTTEWIIPGDTTITATFPAHAGEVEWDCDGQDFTDQGATGQAVATSALNIANDGNTAVKINARFTN